MKLSQINFHGQPYNYAVVDKYLSRSAQPKKEDFAWLKEQGVTDVFNFRSMVGPKIDFNEKDEVEKLGMKYHSIPSASAEPSETNVDLFLKKIEEIIAGGGKAHIHCMGGADRTGMYSLIYKMIKGICCWTAGVIEMHKMGYNHSKYPELVPWVRQYLLKNSFIKK